MATKEDILEQIAEEYYLHLGYFVRHNVKFKPSPLHVDFDKNKDSNASDIDILAIHPLKAGTEKVVVVSCKSWQSGFRVDDLLAAIQLKKKRSGREAWKGFRELVIPKWSAAFLDKVEQETGSRLFTYVIAVTDVRGDATKWEKHELFTTALAGNPIKIVPVSEMISFISSELTTTLAATEVGRLLQILRGAKIDLTGGRTKASR